MCVLIYYIVLKIFYATYIFTNVKVHECLRRYFLKIIKEVILSPNMNSFSAES